MTMTNEEIVRHYSQAKNKTRDINVLADLNSVAPSRIRQVLAEAGVEGVNAPKQVRQAAKPVAAAEPAETARQTADPFPLVYSQIETILAALPDSLPLEVRRRAGGLLSELFAGYLEERLDLIAEFRTGGEEVRNHE